MTGETTGSERVATSGPAVSLAKWTGRRRVEALVAEGVVEIISATTVNTTLKKRTEALAAQGPNMPRGVPATGLPARRGSVEWGTPDP